MPTDIDVTLQITIWGYALLGDVCERSAAIAENRNVEAVVPDAWDHNIAWLAMRMVAHGDENYHMPPEHWCLPAVTELRIRRDQQFWDVALRG